MKDRDKGLILAIINWSGGIVKGVTRLQKIVFLIQKEIGLGDFKFIPYKYGPYSKEIDDLIIELKDEGLIDISEEDLTYILHESPLKILKLTKDGMREAEHFIDNLDKEVIMKAKFYTRIYSHVALIYLIAYVYAKYPEYTTFSQIREAIRNWREIYGLRFLYIR